MENRANQSQGGDSSIKTDQLQGQSSGDNVPTAFVNHGLLLWNQTRRHWMQNRKFVHKKQLVRKPKLNSNTTYNRLLGSKKRFSQPIPLGEMVNFLVDIWEQEGLYEL